MKILFGKSAAVALVLFIMTLIITSCQFIPPDNDNSPGDKKDPDVPVGLSIVCKYSANKVFAGFTENMDTAGIENIANYEVIFDPDNSAEEKTISSVSVINDKSVVLTLSGELPSGEYEVRTENLTNKDGEALAADSSAMRFLTVPSLDYTLDLDYIDDTDGIVTFEADALTLPVDSHWFSFRAVAVPEGTFPALLLDSANVVATGPLDQSGMLSSSFGNSSLGIEFYRFIPDFAYDIYIQGEYDRDGNPATVDDRYYTFGEKTAFRSEWIENCDSFVVMWGTDYQSKSITLPLTETGNYDFTVEWGDGTSDRITSHNDPGKTHVYDDNAIYILLITGTIEGFAFTSRSFDIEEIMRWGPLKLGNEGGYFNGCHWLQISATDIPDLSGTTNMHNAFKNCMNLKTIPNINEWDVSGITDMSGMFENAFSFNDDIGDWYVGNVTDMSSMFALNDETWLYYSELIDYMAFNKDIGDWEVGKVENMSCMFSGNIKFNQDIGDWDVSGVTDMSGMFAGTRAFNQDISGWDVSAVTDMSYMFFIDPIIPPYPDGMSVTVIDFYSTVDTYAFNQEIGWDPVSQTGWDVSGVTNMKHMFDGTTDFNGDIGGWDVSNVTDMSFMFRKAQSFNRDIGGWNVGNVASMAFMFQSSPFNHDISGWDVSRVTNMVYMFNAAVDFNQPIGSWDVGNVTTMSGMFYDADCFNQDINWDPVTQTGWDVSSVTDMVAMFAGADSFNQDIGNWNVANVENMLFMFRDTSFNQDISGWNVSSVRNLGEMFGNNQSFNQDLSAWNVIAATDMLGIFNSTALSTDNYDAILNAWSQLNVQQNVRLSAPDTKYSAASSIARQKLIDDYNWEITDDGMVQQ